MTDQQGLILSARRGARSGSFQLPLDDALADAVEELRARQAEEAEAAGEQEADVARPQRVESALPVREIQARLRQGRSVQDVAKAAGVEPEWVERFADPVFAERAQVISKVRGMTLRRARLGTSSHAIGDAVRRNLAERGVALSPEEFIAAWSARQLADGRWAVRFAFRHRNKEQVLRFDLDDASGAVVAADRFSGQIGYVTPPVGDSPAPRPRAAKTRAEARPAAKRATVTTGFRPGGDASKAVSRPAKERERANAAMSKAAAKRAAEGERAAARRAKEKEAEAARRERAEKAEEARRARERAALDRAKVAAKRKKAAAAKKVAAEKARRKAAQQAAAQAKRAEATLAAAERAAARAAARKAAPRPAPKAPARRSATKATPSSAARAPARRSATKRQTPSPAAKRIATTASPTKATTKATTKTSPSPTRKAAPKAAAPRPAAPQASAAKAPIPRAAVGVAPMPASAEVSLVFGEEPAPPVRPEPTVSRSVFADDGSEPTAARPMFRPGLVEPVADRSTDATPAPINGVAPPRPLDRPRRTRPLRAT